MATTTTQPRTSRFERIADLLLTLMASEHPLGIDRLVRTIPGYPIEGDYETLRTAFERDKRILREQGYDIQTDSTGDRYRLRPRAKVVDRVGLSAKERSVLALAMSVTRFERPAARRAMARLASETSEQQWQDWTGTSDVWRLSLLRLALSTRRSVRFISRGRTCDVEPYGLVGEGQHAVLVGRDQHQEGCCVRSYRVATMTGHVLLGSPGCYELPVRFDPRASFPDGSVEEILDIEPESFEAIVNRAADAGDRLSRLIAILGFIARCERVDLEFLARCFQMQPGDLRAELETAACCGAPPFTPDRLLGIVVDDEVVSGYGLETFNDGMALTSDEAAEAALAARALLELQDFTGRHLLAHALAKLQEFLDWSTPTPPCAKGRAGAERFAALIELRVGEAAALQRISPIVVGSPKQLEFGDWNVTAFLADRRWTSSLRALLTPVTELETVDLASLRRRRSDSPSTLMVISERTPQLVH